MQGKSVLAPRSKPMIRIVPALVASLLLTSAAVAGPMASDRQVSVRTAAPRYVVSANLNKLVFWHVPDRGMGSAQR